MALVYLAGPIDHVSADESRGWREESAEYLFGKGVGTFSPVHAFKAPTNEFAAATCEAMVAVNDEAIRQSHAVLANLTGKSFGTPLECELARGLGIPVVAFGLSEYSVYRHRFIQVLGPSEGCAMLVQMLVEGNRSSLAEMLIPPPDADVLGVTHHGPHGQS